MKKTTRLMSLIIAAALILSGCNQNNVVSHGIPDTNGSDTTITTTAITTSVTTTEATTTTSAAASETKETTPATTVSIEETTVPVDAEVDVTEDTTTPAETTEITAEQAPVETTATTTSVTETTVVTTVSTTRATTTSTVILAYTSASVANKPEPAHIYIQEYDKLGQGLIYLAGYNEDINTGAFIIIEDKDYLDYALNKAYKYWDTTYGGTYGEAQAKVFYYTGKTYLYTRNGGSSTTTTTSATTTVKPATTAADEDMNIEPVTTTIVTTSRTTAASTTAKPQTTAVTITASAETTVVPSNVPFIDDYKSKYLYNALNEEQKLWYDYIFNKVRYGISAKEPRISNEDERIAQLAYEKSSPHAVLYRRSEDVRKKIEKIANKIVEKALKESTPYNQLKVIHDELCKLAEYGGSSSMTDLFLSGEGICGAYADAFTYLCQLAGYDCTRVSGQVLDGSTWYLHEWNIVKIEGKWYYVDVSSDDISSNKYRWFLKGSNAMSELFSAYTNLNYPTASKTDYKA